ncbi:hypothetical protein Daura_21635 [Dactylosporangium aurantiacum]|uniref:Uncharacterized protein n=1 Tax=Dactylosporangium aurantiacum TaxID=35754 RepID=A0A9Q9ILX0_9ACTN|nr:hypothetical protein [Dactylosporangium aurantiacum]MDG6108260.1 hypothetical protein [Dactylosporangium aurantiacum]UWZ58547.1 hypothetical protein Daura_21635 [Dactylosporangium aurantiacum]
MVFTRQVERDEPATRGDAVTAHRTAIWRSGWWPAALVLLAGAGLLRYYDVSLATYAIFVGYVGLGVTLPGLLLWRLVHRGSRSMAEDAAAGTAIGFAIEVLAYIPARAVGVPLAAQAVLLLVIAVFVAVPGLRRYWRGAGPAGRAPLAWSWTLAVIALIMLAWATKYYRHHGTGWPSYGRIDIDLPFHLALIGEFKHHMDFVTPWVTSEPIRYHWFAYAEMASTSWATGIEPFILVTRLTPLVMTVAYAVLIASFGRRLIGTWWGGALTVLATFFVLSPDPYGWVLSSFYRAYGFDPTEDGSNLALYLWTSPTQTFGALLFVPLMLVLLDLLREHGNDRRRWVLFALLPAAVMGAKATFLPTLLCGLLLVIGAQLVFQRRLNRVALKALGIVVFWILFAQFVLFGGESQGLSLRPLEAMRRTAIAVNTNYAADPKLSRLVVLCALTVLCWVFMWAGVAGLRRRVFDAEVLLLAGLGLAGIGALLLTAHSGGSESYFLTGARPYVAAAATWGLLLLLPGLTLRKARPLLAVAVAGIVVVYLIRAVDGDWAPWHNTTYSAERLTIKLVYPYAALALVALAAVAAIWWYRRRIPTGTAVGLIVALLLGFSLPTAFTQLTYVVTDGHERGWRNRAELWPIVTEGTVEAGRWLRGNSSPGDLVATNAHCVYLHFGKNLGCDRRHFGIAAYTERRVLIESWAYTAAAHEQEIKQGVPQEQTTYWDPSRLIDNDAAFTNPSETTIGRLRDGYGVKWLWVEDVSNWYWTSDPPSADEVHVSADLGRYATLRFRSGHVAVYEIR